MNSDANTLRLNLPPEGIVKESERQVFWQTVTQVGACSERADGSPALGAFTAGLRPRLQSDVSTLRGAPTVRIRVSRLRLARLRSGLKRSFSILAVSLLLCLRGLQAAQSASLTEAQERFKKKETLLAMLAAQKAVEEDQNNPACHHLYGLILVELKQFSQAEAHLRKALSQDPMNGEYHYALGAMLLQEQLETSPGATPSAMTSQSPKSRREKETLELLERAVQLDPNHLKARLHLGRTYHGRNMSRLAFLQFKEIQKRDPKYPLAHYHLSAIHLSEGELDAAVKELHTEVALHPESASARLELADLLLHTGLPKQALEHLLASERADSTVPDVHFALGKAYRDLGDLDKAIEAVRKCVALSPQLPAAHHLLAELYEKKGDSKSARDEMGLFERLRTSIAAELAEAYRALDDK